MQTTTLSSACFTVQNGAVVDGTLRDFDSFIERTTRPTGVGPKYYATTISRDGADVWVLAKWATWGGPQVVVREFESEADALAAAEETYVSDILGNSEISIWLDRASAEQELADLFA